MTIHCEDATNKRKRAVRLRRWRPRDRRGFTIFELIVASTLFLVAAAVLSLAVAESIATTAESSARRQVEAALSQGANQIVTAPNAYDALLNNTFSVASPCSNTNTIGTSATSCFVVNATTYTASWKTVLGSDALGLSANAAQTINLTGTINFSDGTTVSTTRIVTAPSYGYQTGTGVLRVTVSDPSNLLSSSSPLYLLSTPSTPSVVAGTTLSGSSGSYSALFRVAASSCTSSSPCVLGLSPGTNFAVSGSAALSASQVMGPGSQIVLTAGQSTSANLTIQRIGTAVLSLNATNSATGQTGANPVPGSVCLYAQFQDGVALEDIPVCNFGNPQQITLNNYTYGLPFPSGVPITLTTDNGTAATGSCPVNSDWSGSGGTSLGAGSNSSGVTWTSANATCTSNTWGDPTSFTFGGVTTPWSSAPTITLSAGSTVSGTVTWSGSGVGSTLYATDGGNALRSVTMNGISTSAVLTPGQSFSQASGVAVDQYGNKWIADTGHHDIVEVTANGVTTVVAGVAGTGGYVNGVGTAAKFNQPRGLAYDPRTGNLFIADSINNVIRVMNTTTLAVSTVATGTLSQPRGVAIDLGGSGDLVVADTLRNNIVVVVPGSGGSWTTSTSYICAGPDATTSPANTFPAGSLPAIGTTPNVYTGTAARFRSPGAVATDDVGDIYVADTGNNTIDYISGCLSQNPSNSAGTGSASIFAGQSLAVGSTDGTASAAKFSSPNGLVYTNAGPNPDTLFVSDGLSGTTGNVIRQVDAAGNTTTLSGSSGTTSLDVDGSASVSRYNNPLAIGVSTTYSSTLGYMSGDSTYSTTPAVGYSTVPVWSEPNDTSTCASTTCLPEQDNLTTVAVPQMTAPNYNGMRAVYLPAYTSTTSGATLNFEVSLVDNSGGALSASVTSLPATGNLYWCKTSCSTKTQITSASKASPYVVTASGNYGPVAAGGGTLLFQYYEGSGLTLGQTSFNLVVGNGTSTVTYPIVLYRTAAPWVVTGFTATTVQNSSTTLGAAITLANGAAATTSSVTFACATSCPGVSFSSPTSETNGVATSTVSVTSSARAGTYAVTVTSGSVTGTAYLTVTPVAGSVSVSSVSPTSVSQGGSATATVVVNDLASQPMAGVSVNLNVNYSGSLALGVYAPVGSCTTSASGTCTITVQAESTASSGNYTLVASTGSLSGTASLTVTSSRFLAGAMSVCSGCSIQVTIQAVDGSGNPVSGQAMTFTSNLSGLSVSPSSATTPSNGTITVTLTASSALASGTYLRAVTASGGGNTARFSVQITGGVASVQLSGSVVQNPGDTQTLQLYLYDASGTPVPFRTVSVTPSSGASWTASMASATSTTSGVVSVNITQGGSAISDTSPGSLQVIVGGGGGQNASSYTVPLVVTQTFGTITTAASTTDSNGYYDIPSAHITLCSPTAANNYCFSSYNGGLSYSVKDVNGDPYLDTSTYIGMTTSLSPVTSISPYSFVNPYASWRGDGSISVHISAHDATSGNVYLTIQPTAPAVTGQGPISFLLPVSVS